MPPLLRCGLPRLPRWLPWLLLPGLAAGEEGGKGEGDAPTLSVMYLKYRQEPIDTTPVFTPETYFYNVRLDWKMKFFSVQATPVLPAVIDNVHLCPQHADCSKQDQLVVTMDFSRNIVVPPGAQVRYRFDVLKAGVTRTYTIVAHRLEGSEVDIRQMILQGSTLYPGFKAEQHVYRSLLPVTMELASLEVHLQDSGQTILASASTPVLLDINDNITSLRNSHPGNTRAPPTRLRRLRERDYGEFQYPNKYIQFPVPLASKRSVHFKVLSADGGHFGYYSLELARPDCTSSTPLFDAVSGSCVSFCNEGFWADDEAHRCKRCPQSCHSCESLYRCLRCPAPDPQQEYELSNGRCLAKPRKYWQEHSEYALALLVSAISVAVFFCGALAFCCSRSSQRRRPLDPGQQAVGVAMNAGGVPGHLLRKAPGPMQGRGVPPGYAPISGYDDDQGF